MWQKAYQFVLSLYRMTDSFPKREIYGLTSQMRRAAVSVVANIAEGFRRRGKSDKVRFLNISQGSLEESRCFLFLCRDLDYADSAVLLSSLGEVSKLLDSYSKAILASDS